MYSPGYFEINLTGGGSVQIAASILTDAEPDALSPVKVTSADFRAATDSGIETNMLDAMRAFVVKRGDLKTVIAGYPWFLDWGRDTLIAARGLIAAREFRNDVKAIIRQFAMFAEQGTIPNIIHGDTVGNRDTSDAQLWLFTAVEDLCKAERSNDFLKTEVRPGKTILDKLEEIAACLIAGTPNGIKTDPASGLVFSPPHFTWMDTNYPAGTPREGYPVEIQALWFAAPPSAPFSFRTTANISPTVCTAPPERRRRRRSRTTTYARTRSLQSPSARSTTRSSAAPSWTPPPAC